MVATKLAVLLAMTSCLFSSVEAIQCKDIDESVTFAKSVCEKTCKDKKDTDKFTFSESEKGGAFAYKCDCDGTEYCKDNKYDPNATAGAVGFYALSLWALAPGILLALRNL